VQINLNGKRREIQEGLSIGELLRQLCLRSGLVAVEHNGEVLAPEAVDARVLREDDQLEVVRFVGGG